MLVCSVSGSLLEGDEARVDGLLVEEDSAGDSSSKTGTGSKSGAGGIISLHAGVRPDYTNNFDGFSDLGFDERRDGEKILARLASAEAFPFQPGEMGYGYSLGLNIFGDEKDAWSLSRRALLACASKNHCYISSISLCTDEDDATAKLLWMLVALEKEPGFLSRSPVESILLDVRTNDGKAACPPGRRRSGFFESGPVSSRDFFKSMLRTWKQVPDRSGYPRVDPTEIPLPDFSKWENLRLLVLPRMPNLVQPLRFSSRLHFLEIWNTQIQDLALSATDGSQLSGLLIRGVSPLDLPKLANLLQNQRAFPNLRYLRLMLTDCTTFDSDLTARFGCRTVCKHGENCCFYFGDDSIRYFGNESDARRNAEDESSSIFLNVPHHQYLGCYTCTKGLLRRRFFAELELSLACGIFGEAHRETYIRNHPNPKFHRRLESPPKPYTRAEKQSLLRDKRIPERFENFQCIVLSDMDSHADGEEQWDALPGWNEVEDDSLDIPRTERPKEVFPEPELYRDCMVTCTWTWKGGQPLLQDAYTDFETITVHEVFDEDVMEDGTIGRLTATRRMRRCARGLTHFGPNVVVDGYLHKDETLWSWEDGAVERIGDWVVDGT